MLERRGLPEQQRNHNNDIDHGVIHNLADHCETATTTSTKPDPIASTSSTSMSTTTRAPDAPIVETTIGPPAGTTWAVVGIAHDDVLNVRIGPGARAPIVETLDPTSDGLVATGQAGIVDRRTIWWEVATDTGQGWVAAPYLAGRGSTDDVTASVIAASEHGWPTAETITSLAMSVAEIRGADRVVVVAAPSDEGLHAEIVLDLFVDYDDALRGERLLVVGQRSEPGGELALFVVESTVLCWRDVDTDGLCV
ncbi:MAG: hypothetical protein ACR2N7_01115 [Acidimicrobiia bacterium]